MSSTVQGIRLYVSPPDQRLRPNGKKGKPGHVSKLKRERYEAAWAEARQALNGARIADAPEYAVSIEIHGNPSTVDRMDADNIVAALKWDFDGIAEALGVDDRRFRTPRVTGREKEPDVARQGAVIEVTAVQDSDNGDTA